MSETPDDPAGDARPRPGDGAAPVPDTAPSPVEPLAGGEHGPRRSVSRYTSPAERPPAQSSRQPAAEPAAGEAITWRTEPRTRIPGRGRRGLLGTLPARRQPAPAEIVSTTAGALVSAAKVGRLLGRTGLRLARQLPGAGAVEAQAQRMGQAAAAQLLRSLDLPQQLTGSVTAEERRVMMLVQDGSTDPEPLRTAMSELLHRSSASDSAQGREYLFGTIISQLVPDEARILAALSGGRRFAALDVLAKQVGRSQTRSVLANASTVGAAAHVALPGNVPTYLTRLHTFGLLEFSAVTDDLESQFAALLDEPMVRAARTEADGKFGSAKLSRKSVTLTPLGQEFWAACAPSAGGSDRLSG